MKCKRPWCPRDARLLGLCDYHLYSHDVSDSQVEEAWELMRRGFDLYDAALAVGVLALDLNRGLNRRQGRHGDRELVKRTRRPEPMF